MDPYEKFIEMGERFGLSGEELKDFADKKEIERDSRLNFETLITNQQFLPRQPTFMDASFSKHTFEDDNEWDVTSKIDRLV